MTTLGRQESWEDSPEGYPQTPPYKWWNWYDAYDEAPSSTRPRSQTWATFLKRAMSASS
jgi:hypothetical protein